MFYKVINVTVNAVVSFLDNNLNTAWPLFYIAGYRSSFRTGKVTSS